METRHAVWTLIVLALFAWAIIATCKPIDKYGTEVNITVSANDKITIEWADFVHVKAVDDKYFRIYSGDFRLLAEPDQNDEFFAMTDNFPTKNWEIKDGSQVDITITSSNPIHVHRVQAGETILLTVVIFIVLAILLWLLGMLVIG